MAKVSIGLRGWRFDEEEVFTDDGEFRALDSVPEDTRKRLIRLTYLQEKPCDACYLVHGEAEQRRANQAEIVYGEPMEEVLLCSEHEADFLYWFREEGGKGAAGTETFRDEFHEWFAADNRAPEGYGPDEHVEESPGELPNLPTPEEAQRRLEQSVDFEEKRYDLRAAEEEEAGEELDVADLDLDTEYPSG